MGKTKLDVPASGIVEWWRKITKAANHNGHKIRVHHLVVHEFETGEAMLRVPWHPDQGFPTKIVQDEVAVWLITDD
jgi:hypothetical protein